MKKLLYFPMICLGLLFGFSSQLDAQTYLLNSASNNTTVSTCGGSFFDSGGGAGNYSNNENYTISFCSNASTCIVATFTAFRTQSGNDILTVYDGPNNTYPLLGTFWEVPFLRHLLPAAVVLHSSLYPMEVIRGAVGQ